MIAQWFSCILTKCTYMLLSFSSFMFTFILLFIPFIIVWCILLRITDRQQIWMRFMYNTSVCINNPKLFLTIPLGKTSSYCTSFSQYKVIPLYEQDKMNIRKYMVCSLTLCTKREYLDKSSLCQIGNVFCCRIIPCYDNAS